MKKLMIIKLGGSVITYKESKTPKVRLEIIKSLASQIQKILQSKKFNILLVHGAGSFGHPLAKKYGLKDGMYNSGQKLGFSLTAQKMIELQTIIINELLSKKIPAVSIPPRAFIKQTNGQIDDIDHTIIKSLLEQEIIPVLSGDMVFDTAKNCSVLSGDVIVSFLSKKLKADKTIFLSDVDGIFNKNPKIFKNAKRIPRITNYNLTKVLKTIKLSNNDDVTGEIKGKIMAIKRTLKGIEVIITNGLKKDILIKIINKKIVGTILLF